MRLALELADAGLVALPEEGEVAVPSPGLAIIDGEAITIGREAAARARLAPRRLNSRFWRDISTEALGRPFGRRLRSADLAWTHLSQLWRETGHSVTSVILALSGGRSETQLGLILGVARSAGLPVDGLVDSAVAAAFGRANDTSMLHLDLELHRMVLTVIAPGPKQQAVLVSDQVGLVALHDAWLRFIAGEFLKHTRFDPFHSAASEQELFDRLPTILGQLGRRKSTTVTLAANENPFTIELDREQMESVAKTQNHELDELIRSALAHQPGGVLLTARAASVPGLAVRLARLTGLEIVELPLAAAAASALLLAQRIVAPGPALPFVTDLGTVEY